jgi:hypothetical protein
MVRRVGLVEDHGNGAMRRNIGHQGSSLMPVQKHLDRAPIRRNPAAKTSYHAGDILRITTGEGDRHAALHEGGLLGIDQRFGFVHKECAPAGRDVLDGLTDHIIETMF